MSAWTEVVRRIGDEDSDRHSAYLTVQRDESEYGVTIVAESESDKSWFGDVNLTLSKEIAEQLGHALIAASKECEG